VAGRLCPYLALTVVGFPSSPMKTTRILTGAVPLFKAWYKDARAAPSIADVADALGVQQDPSLRRSLA